MKKKSALFLLVVIVLFSFLSVSFVYALGAPIKISTTTTDDTVFPQTVTDSSGYLHMVWMEVVPIDCSGIFCVNIWGSYQNTGILYSRWNGDTWSTPLNISSNTGFAESPSLAADTNNTIHVVWDDQTNGNTDPCCGDFKFPKIAYKTRSSTGTWSAIETLPLPSGTFLAGTPQVAIDNTNTPNIVFASHATGTCCDDAIYWTKKVSGAWTTPEKVSKNASGSDINDSGWSNLRSDNLGNLHLIYWSSVQGTFYRKYSGGTWSTPFQITTRGDFHRIAVTPAGEVFVTWHATDISSIEVRWTQGGVWQTPTTLSTNSIISFWNLPIMGVTTDSKERAHVGWGERDVGGLIDLRYRSFVPGAGWQPVQDVDLDNSDADTPFVYPDKWDNQHFAWTEYNPANTRWELMYRVAEGTIQTVGSTGGTITANPGNVTYVTLDIPASALSSDTQIGIQIGPVPESVNPAQVTIPRSFTFRPNGLIFNVPKKATATITYTDPEVAGSDERDLKPWVWNSATNAWEARNGTNNANANTIKVDLTGFSLYGISAPLVNTTWLRPLPNEIIKQAALLFEFQLKYADGTEVIPPADSSELMVQLRNESDTVVKEMEFAPSEVIRDEGKKVYKDTLRFQKDGLPNGNYKLEVYLTGNLVGQQSFTLAR